jgi:NADPH:quinone reductase-like Zn-dependent oxidoreductase
VKFSGKDMRAIIQERYGAPDEVLHLRDIDIPTQGPDELLVRVRAASVHADVWHVVTGYPRVLRLMGAGLRKPKQPIPGSDMAGIVEAVGRDVTGFAPGDAVFGETHRQMQWVNGGAYAEYVCVPQDVLSRKPQGITFEQAASVPTAGMIAVNNLDGRLWSRPGQRVMINGAAGGVGSIAIQIAKAKGAFVVGTDHTIKQDFMRSLGADEVVDYTREDITRRGDRYDLIVDVASTLSLSDCKRILQPDGAYVIIGHDHYGKSGRRTLGSLPHIFGLMARAPFERRLPRPRFETMSKHDAMEILRGLIEAGKLTPVVARTFPLAQAPTALRSLQEEQLCGRIVVVP